MYNDENGKKSKLQFYHIIFLGCFLGIVLMINSNFVNNERTVIKLNKEKSEFFEKIVYGRKLSEVPQNDTDQGEEEYETETDAVCHRASQELIDYYNGTSTLKDLGLSEGGIKCEDKDTPQMKALISIISSLLGGDSKEEEENPDNNVSPQPNVSPDEGRRLRNLISFDDEMKNNLITYGKSILPLLVFFAMSILCIFGWIICCFCNCCNCCCCCCCKKPGCKIPCFLFTVIFYGGAIAVCIYVITKASGIFTGLANTECSILRFFDEILFGEMKMTTPRWAGIEGINNILNDLTNTIGDMGPSTYQVLEDAIANIEEEEEYFDNMLKNAGDEFYDNGNYRDEEYSLDYTGKGRFFSVDVDINPVGKKSVKAFDYKDRCVLDVIQRFGRYVHDEDDPSTGSFQPEISFLSGWYSEYSIISSEANSNLQRAKEGFRDILDENLDTIMDTLGDAQDKFDSLRKPIDNIYDQIASSIYEYSMMIDDYGKPGIKLCFYALALLNGLLGFFMFLICMCSGKLCVNCCFCRCICKFMTHLLWNILALLMIVTFLVGSILALLGKIGGDMMSVLSYVMSEENFNDKSPLLINKLGKANQYLNCCMNGDGDIAGQLNISDQIGSFDEIYTAQSKIQEAIQNFSSVLEFHFAYNYAKEFYDKRVNYETDEIAMFNLKNETLSLVLKVLLQRLNEKIEDKHEKWDLTTGDHNKKCELGSDPAFPTNSIFHPKYCRPTYRDWIEQLDPGSGDTDTDISVNSDIINYAYLITDMVNTIDNLESGDFMPILNNLLEGYKKYLGSFISALQDFNQTINSITSILEEYIGNNANETFSFLNGKFIGTNLKIVLKYLKEALGKDVYTVGLCLVAVGGTLIFSISSTILTIVIINVDIDNKKMFENEENQQISEFADTEDEIIERKRRKSRGRSRRKSKNKYYN